MYLRRNCAEGAKENLGKNFGQHLEPPSQAEDSDQLAVPPLFRSMEECTEF